MTQDIITELSRFCSFLVVAQEFGFGFKDPAANARAIGQTLGAAYVVSGSIRLAAVRVSAQLIECATSKHVWSERYDRDLQDILAVQDEITQTIAATMGAGSRRQDTSRPRASRPTALESYD